MEAILCTSGYIVPCEILQSVFSTSQLNTVLKKLTYTYHPKIGPPKTTKLYKNIVLKRGETNINCIQFPRTLAGKFSSIIKYKLQIVPMQFINAPTLCVELFENQNIVIGYLMKNIYTKDRIKSGTASAILNLRPGLGKTYVAAGLIYELRNVVKLCAEHKDGIIPRTFKTLYVVPKIPLAVQAVRDLRNCLSGITIGKFYTKEKKKDFTTHLSKQDVTVIVVDSALNQPKEFFAKYSFVIFDEVHSYCTERKRVIFQAASTWAMLGMSGTTNDRKDGLDVVSHRELAPDGVIFAEKIPGFTYDEVNFAADVTIWRYNGPAEYTRVLCHESTGGIFTPYMNRQFMDDPYRLKLLLNSLTDLYNWRDVGDAVHCVYVFCEELQHVEKIYNEFTKILAGQNNEQADRAEAILAPELDVGCFVGGSKEDHIRKMATSARVFITTYGYSSTGISIDKMTAIIFATPRRANMKQIIPRILRRGGNQNIKRRIIDIVDNKTPIKYQLGDRMIVYKYYNMDISDTKINYTEI